MKVLSGARPRRTRRGPGERVTRMLGAASRCVPVLGLVALVLAALAVAVEGEPVSPANAGERLLRGMLFVLSCFVGSYMPVAGQPDTPSVLSTWALVLALATSLGGVALAVLRVFAREMGLAVALLRPQRVVVIGDTPQARTFASRLRDDGRTVVTVGVDATAMVRVAERADISRDLRVRRAVRGATATYILHESSVDGALTAAEIRGLSGRPRTFQMFDWEMDRLVFREPIRGGEFPGNEVFSPVEITGIHIAHLIAHMVRMRGRVLRLHLRGGHRVLDIVQERLTFMRGALRLRGGVEFVDSQEHADIVVLGVEQHSYVSAVDDAVDADRIVFAIAPEEYFAAVGREDLGAVSSARWLAERDSRGAIRWAARVVLVDESRIGSDIGEVSLGIRGCWAREFHNAHSDFGDRDDPRRGSPNRWLDSPPHPRLVAMANAAVDLMLRDLDALGYELVVRAGAHHTLTDNEIEECARHIHEQYLALTWRDDQGAERRCADYFVTAEGHLIGATPPPSWEEDTEHGRQRNRAMVREVYPALAAIFGYRITRARRTDDRGGIAVVRS